MPKKSKRKGDKYGEISGNLGVLIAAFSGYGIFNLSAKLGSRFLDKLDSVVDYGATCRITAIHLHVDEINVFEKYEKSIS
ncbi:23681_t:CDS:2 [Entrophospora sp. SA101]|nr:12362_t:CDS:2 [Entrophospora sp. SA101]CAJ0754862.1 23681_t:CDS:2 [Entrophospora sp. SA101]